MIRSCCAALLGLFLFASSAFAAEKELIVASDATWPPLEMLDAEKNVVGYSIDYLKAVAKEAGLPVTFRNTAWDGIFAAHAPGPPDPACAPRPAVVVPGGSATKGPADRTGLKVGGQIGTTGLIETMPKSKVDAVIKTYDEVGLALEDLAKGNIDAVVCDSPVAQFYANKKDEYKGKLRIAHITDDVEYYGFALRKDDQALIDALNKGIAAVKAKGLDKAIIEKWLGE